MAINFTDFTNAKTHQSGLRDLLSNVLKGYQLAKMPGQMRQEEEQRDLRNEEGRLRNSLLGYENEYAPQQYEQQAEQRDLANQLSRINVGARPGEIDRNRQQDEMKIEMLSNELGVHPEMIRLALQQKEAELAKIQGENEYAPNKRALEEAELQAKIANYNNPNKNRDRKYTTAEQNAIAIGYKPETPAFEQAVRDMVNKKPVISEQEKEKRKDWPSTAIPLEDFDAITRRKIISEQSEIKKRLNSAATEEHDLKVMKSILKRHPQIGDTFSQIFASPVSKDKISEFLKRFQDPELRKDLETFNKIAEDFAIRQLGSLSGRQTNAQLLAIQNAKPSIRNTTEANLAVIRGIEREIKPFLRFGKDFRKVQGRALYEYDSSDYPPKPEEMTDDELLEFRREAQENAPQ